MILKIGAAVGVAFAGVFSYVALKPPEYTISREIEILATPNQIFPFLNNQKLAEQWSPWKVVDPEAHMVYEGPESGIGSKASWASSGKLGSGSATILESIENERVNLKLIYIKPMEMEQDATYMIQTIGDKSIVTWKVEGKNSLVGRFVGLFMDMDKLVGSMFESGLSNLKTLVESKHK